MPYFHCHDCHSVRYEPEAGPFVWCGGCGAVMDCSAQMAHIDDVGANVPRRRFERRTDPACAAARRGGIHV
jgi:hypothetical protein